MLALSLPPRLLIASALALIPTHRQTPQTAADLLSQLIIRTGATEAEAQTALAAAFALLDAFNGLRWQATAKGGTGSATTQTRSQLTTYFSRSLQLALEAGEGWQVTPGLLRLLEQQRIEAAERTGNPAIAAREQSAVSLLIVQRANEETQLLHQFDIAAGQYQLIGGRLEPGELLEAAAWRELQEEIGVSQPQPLRADEITLSPAIDKPLMLQNISATYGVLTHYTFFAYHLRRVGSVFQSGPLDRWISVREMLAGRADDGQSLGFGDIARSLDTRLQGGLAALPSSFD